MTQQKEWKKKRRFRQSFARFLHHIAKRTPGTACPEHPRSIAILAQEKLGDCILLTPLLENLRTLYPNLELHVITFSRASEQFLKHDPNITALHSVKHGAKDYMQKVLSTKFDILFNTKDSPSTNFLIQTALIRATCKVGHYNEFHAGLFDQYTSIPYQSHMALKNCALLQLLGHNLTPEACRPKLPPMPVSKAMQHFISTMPKEHCIGLNISAGEQNRTWPEARYKELVELLPAKQFIILSAPEDFEKKQRLEQQPNVTPSPGTKNLYEAGLLVVELQLLITPDTSLIHVASATSTPVLGLYREAPQDITRFGPFLVPSELVISATGEVAGITPGKVAVHIERLRTKLPATP